MQTKNTPATVNNTAITAFNADDYGILDPGQMEVFRDAMMSNLDGEKIHPRKILTAVPMPTGGGTIFNYESGDGDVTTKEITGIIIHIQTERALFLGAFGENKLPECSSYDGVTGFGNPGGLCVGCADNEFPADGGSKNCKESKIIYIVTKEELLPIALRCTPGSFKALQEYRIKLVKKGMPMHKLETVFSLTSSKNKAQIKFSQLVLTPGTPVANKEAVASLLKIKEDLLPFLTGIKPETNPDPAMTQPDPEMAATA
jgi:hypothetical protein